MRSLKYSGTTENDYRCGICFHVRTGTIMLGIWYLLMHVLVMSMIAVILVHPEMLNEQRNDGIISLEPENDKSYEFHISLLRDCKWTTHDIDIGMIATFGTFLITVLMVYGAIKGKPKLLLPFFCFQCFDFCLACLSAVGYFTYMPDVRQIIMKNPSIPFQKELLSMDAQLLSLLIFISFIVVMIIKAYFIGVVWSYYKYLITAPTFNTPELVNVETQVLLPAPDYETATKDSKESFDCSTPPPPYTPRFENL